MFDYQEVLAQAQRELQQEAHRAAVEAEKLRIRQKKPFWHRLFPFEVKITRRK